MTRNPKTSRPNANFITESDSPEAVAKWVRKRLETQPMHQVRAWATAQYKAAGKVLRRYGSDIQCERVRQDVERAKQHRRWISRIRRALDAVETGRRRHRPFWRRTKPGVWGHEVMTYQAQQAAAKTATSQKRPRSPGQADCPGSPA